MRLCRVVSLAVALMLVVSACGSTAQRTNTIAGGEFADEAAEDGLSLSGPTTPGARQPQAPGAQQPQAPGAQQPQAPGAQQPQAPTNQASRSSGNGNGDGGGTKGRGFTENEIYIGFATWKDSDNAFRAGGMSSQFGDQKAMAQAVIRDINGRGGLAGRMIVPVYYDFSTQEILQNPNSGAQAACEQWTQDRPVFAAVNIIGLTSDTLLSTCLAKKQTLFINQAGALRPDALYSRLAPYLYSGSWPSIDRLVPTWMRRVATNGYFRGGWEIDAAHPGPEPTKVGVLSSRPLSGPEFRNTVRRQLSILGLQVGAEWEWSGDLSRGPSEANQAVVRFREAGVTHVISSSTELWFFTQAAESQTYRPRYTVPSSTRPQSRVDSGQVPPAQFVGAMGVGYAPAFDVGRAHDPQATNEARVQCRKIMETAGQSTSSRDTLAVQLMTCDGFKLLESTIWKGGLSTNTVYSEATTIDSIPSASTFIISFKDGKFDGPKAVRDLAFFESCECFKYTSRKNQGM